MTNGTSLRITCGSCRKEIIVPQPYPYHAGFSDVVFLYGVLPIPVVFVFSLIEFPIAFGCMFRFRRRSRKQFDQAIKEGYPFGQFRLGALHRLLP